MEDKKLEMFFSKELWNETIEKAVKKIISRGVAATVLNISKINSTGCSWGLTA